MNVNGIRREQERERERARLLIFILLFVFVQVTWATESDQREKCLLFDMKKKNKQEKNY